MIKYLTKVDIEITIKAIYDEPTSNIILSREKLKAFLLKPVTRQGCPLSSLLQALATAIRQTKEIKSIQIGWEEVKLSLYADDILLYIETLRTLHNNDLNWSMNSAK